MIQGAAFVFNDYYCLLSESIIEEQEDAQDKHQTREERSQTRLSALSNARSTLHISGNGKMLTSNREKTTMNIFGVKPNNAFNLFIIYITIVFSLFYLPHFHNPVALFFRGAQR